MNISVELMQKEYLWDVNLEDGRSFTVEQMQDVSALEFSTEIWDEDGKLLKKSDGLYLSIMQAIEDKNNE